MSAPERGTATDYSNSERPRTARIATPRGAFSRTRTGSVLAALGLAGGILAFVATWSPVIKIQVLTVTPRSFSGYDRHSVALVLLGAFGIVMTLGALRGARPAMAALAAAGLLILLISVIFDLPHLNDTGVWPEAQAFEDASAHAGSGYYLETLSGVLMMIAGVGSLLLGDGGRPAPGPRDRSSV